MTSAPLDAADVPAVDPIPFPMLLIAELSYRCPLKCPYCSNPTNIGDATYANELETEHWQRAFREAGKLGVLQLALTGGEPMARRDLEQLVEVSTEAGLYSTLVTSAMPFPRARVEALQAAGLDHVQISVQHADQDLSDLIGGTKSFARKMEAAALVKELGMPLTINVVLHRHNLDAVTEIIEMAERLGARRLELANTQYHGWAALNRAALMPSREQLVRGEAAVQEARERLGATMEILWVLPDWFEDLPKPCMGGWAHDALLMTPNGDILPCQSAATIPDMRFPNVRDTSLSEAWFDSEPFNRYRGTAWMPDPCRSCPLDRQRIDFGGCRCQALKMAGDATATDPVCQFSPKHDHLVAAREAGMAAALENPQFEYRVLNKRQLTPANLENSTPG